MQTKTIHCRGAALPDAVDGLPCPRPATKTAAPQGRAAPLQSKTYFWVSKESAEKTVDNVFTYQFPPEFIASRNPKWIVIEECKATFKNQLVGNVLLHASFIHRDHYLDHACCFVNEEANKDTAKYEYNSNVARFELWFTDLHGNYVDMDGFVFRSLLIY